MDRNENNFLDSKTILAIVLVGVFWFGWQSYLDKKYPKQPAQQKTQDAQENNEKVGKTQPSEQPQKNLNSTASVANSKKNDSVAIKEIIENFNSQESQFLISSKGLGLGQIQLNKFTNRNKEQFKFGGEISNHVFEMSLLGEENPIPFELTKVSDYKYEGKFQKGNLTIIRSIEINPGTYSVKNNISFINPDASIKGFQIKIPEKLQPKKSSSMFLPSYEHQEFIVKTADKTERINVSSSSEAISKNLKGISMVALGSQYFATAVVDKSDIIPEVELSAIPGEKDFTAKMIYSFPAQKDRMDFSFTSFAGPKAQSIIQQLDPEFSDLINFGFFSSIGKILLIVLKWFQNFVGNWGLSIIALTLLVRVLVLPFNIASYKSMKKMQKVNPLMQSLREKYKNDPQTLNREMMLLMKDQKVNPLGGCLPMLLQMPVLFALFQVLGQSIELYQAPFFGWIQDLSLKDPFYVLPVLMGATLFVQHKITPNTMDPAQAKVMQFMPVIFSLMMISLPSGLTLYTFISTLFGILQQQFFMRDKHHVVKTAEVKA